jgi:formate dehydrogenase iron-sulfur subunit
MPCRIGSTRGVEVIDTSSPQNRGANALLDDLCATMLDGSLCALGGLTPLPVQSAIKLPGVSIVRPAHRRG